MNTSDLIEKLESFDQDKSVVMDFGYYKPENFMSWRGAYDQPAMSYGYTKITVKEFLELAKEFSGSTQRGYKGGEYIMHSSDDIWVAKSGNSCSTALKDAEEFNYEVVLHTEYKEY